MKIYLKPTLILSAIAGVVLGLIMLIPMANCLSCMVFSFIASGIIIYMKRRAMVGMLTIYDGSIIGAISGFVSMVASSWVYLFGLFMIGLIYKPYHTLGFNISTSFLITSFNLFVTGMLVFFLALLSALFNAFTGLVTAFIYEKLEEDKLDEEAVFTVES